MLWVLCMLEGAQNTNTHDVFRQTDQFYGKIGDPPNRMVLDQSIYPSKQMAYPPIHKHRPPSTC